MSRHEEALRRLSASKEVCVDVETSGLDWRYNHIVGYVLTFGPAPQDSYYLPFRHQPGGNIEGCSVPQVSTGWDGSLHLMEKHIIKELSRQDITILGHNLSFDLKFLYRQGLKFDARYMDTMIYAALINEWMPSFSLDYCAKAAGVAAKKATIYDYIMATIPEARADGPRQAMGHYWRLRGDDPEAVSYAEGDGTSTYQLYYWQAKQLLEQELSRVSDVENRVIPVLAKMTTRGVRIDVDRLHQVKALIEEKLETAKNALPKDFNSKAPTQVRKLMEDNGHTDWPVTPKGAPSFPEKWLETNDVGKQIVAIRKYSNVLSSFVEPMLETHMWNGRVHPEYNQLRGDEYGTVTGRLSSSNPNLQQVHKRNKELGRLYRSIFIPDEGCTWASVDYSQCEPRLLAYYGRVKVLMDGYRNDPKFDAHQGVATASNIDRESGKRINQGLITGMGKGKLIASLNKPEDEALKIWDNYFEALPEIKPLQKRAATAMQNRGYIMSLLGRRSRLNDPSKAYVAVNRLLQCGNADILKLKMVEIDDYLKSEGDPLDMLNNVHDSLDFQFREETRRHYEECLSIMTSFGPDDKINLDIPMRVDAGEGPNWAIATYGEE